MDLTIKMAFTKTAKSATSFSIEGKDIKVPAQFDIAVFDYSKFDSLSGMASKEAKPATTFSKEAKT